MDLINKKTNQWLHYTMSSIGKNSYNKFYLITKLTKCDIKEIIVSYERTDQFLDSLKRNGWTKKIKYKSGGNKYNPKIELNSISFSRLNNTDSVFKFIYKISLTDRKTHTTQTQLDTLFGTEKEKISKSFATLDYKFDEIKIQRETSIILVGLYSNGLLRPFKEEHYDLVIAPWMRYYF